MNTSKQHMAISPDNPNGPLPTQAAPSECLAFCIPLLLMALPHHRKGAIILLGDPTGLQSGPPWIGHLVEHAQKAHKISDNQMAQFAHPASVKMVYMAINPPRVPVLHDCRMPESIKESSADSTERVCDAFHGATRFDDFDPFCRNTDYFVRVMPQDGPHYNCEWGDIPGDMTMAHLVRGRVDATVRFIRAHGDDGAVLRSWQSWN